MTEEVAPRAFCKICAQAIDEPARKDLPNYTAEEYETHLIETHGYPAPIAPPAPPKTNAELTEELDQVYLTLVEFARRLDALEGPPIPIEIEAADLQ